MKKATRTSKLYVGAFFVTVTLLAAVAIMFTGDDLKMFKSGSRYGASFENTAGLHVGAPVKMGGVDIGTVENIAITTEDGVPKILATLVIYAPNDALLKVDSEVSLETQGVLGDKFLNLTSGATDSPHLPPGSFIRTKERTEIGAVVQKSTDIVDSLSKTMAKLEKFSGTLPDDDTMRGLVRDLSGSMREMHGLLKVLNSKDSAVHAVSNDKTGKQIQVTLNKLESAATHLDSVAKKIDEGKGTLGALVNDSSMYDDMRALLGRANRSKTAKYLIQQTLKGAPEGKLEK